MIIQWVIIICTVINIIGVFVNRKLYKMIERKKRRMQIFKEEIDNSLTKMEKLAKSLKGTMRLPTLNMPTLHTLIQKEDTNELDDEKEVSISQLKWTEITEEAHKDLLNMMSKKKKRKKE